MQKRLEEEVAEIFKCRAELKELELDYAESLKTLANLTERVHELECLVSIASVIQQLALDY